MSEANSLDLPWRVVKKFGKGTILIRKATPPDDDEVRPNVCVIESRTIYAEDCADFIVEASVVAHETGRTPKQLAEQRAELLAALTVSVENIERWLETGTPASPEESETIYAQMKSAIGKATADVRNRIADELCRRFPQPITAAVLDECGFDFTGDMAGVGLFSLRGAEGKADAYWDPSEGGVRVAWGESVTKCGREFVADARRLRELCDGLRKVYGKRKERP